MVPQLNLNGKKIVIDCANGAAAVIASELFRSLGGEIHLTHVTPNGRNINENCGALHPEVVARETKALGADLGITFDGDADRALFADAHGRVVNGDGVMLVAARDMQAKGRACRRRGGGDDDVQHGPGSSIAQQRHSHAARSCG